MAQSRQPDADIVDCYEDVDVEMAGGKSDEAGDDSDEAGSCPRQ